jgi:uncharacterized glyoxalase superfamily protein PhnB
MENQIVLTLNVPSIEETAAWYERVLGWIGHFDTFNSAGQCLFGSIILRDDPLLAMNLSLSEARDPAEICTHCSAWIYVDNVEEIYQRVLEQGWPVETPLEDQFWGERTFRLRDLYGNHLILARQIQEIDLEEIRRRQREMG